MKNLIAIVNWNSRSDTEACINSLLADLPDQFDILIIDNHSKDSGWIKQLWSGNNSIHILLNDDNLGFTKSSNQAFHWAIEKDYDYVTFINNDTIVDPEFNRILERILNEFEPDMVTCKLLMADKPEVLDNVGHKLINTGELVPIGHGQISSRYNQSFINSGSCAAATAYSRKMILDIGIYDTYFNTGYEDAEYGLRATVAGYTSRYFPELIVYHKVSQSVSKIDNIEYRVKQQINIYYTYFKLMPLPVIVVNLPFIFIKYLLAVIMEVLLLKWNYLYVHWKTLTGLLKKFNIIKSQRTKFHNNQAVISSWKILRKQEFFLLFDVKRLLTHGFRREETVFDKSNKN